MQLSKIDIHQTLLDQVNIKIEAAEKAIAVAKEARDSETKSSVGDKYETGRAMAQNEQHRNEVQLAQALELKKGLSNIDLDKKYSKVETGALVKTSIGLYYISIGLGALKVNNFNVFAISLSSPIGKAMVGLEQGNEVIFQGRKQLIEEIG